MIEQTFTPGIVTMHDDKGTAYRGDETLFDIIKNRRIWTDKQTGELMIDEVRQHKGQTISQYRLADWWYRIMHLNDLPHDLNVGFKNEDKRDLRYNNLVQLAPKGSESATHDSTTQTLDNPTPVSPQVRAAAYSPTSHV